ncbi:MAG: sialate O-acetylesterase [Armatimonadaceae bacterium]
MKNGWMSGKAAAQGATAFSAVALGAAAFSLLMSVAGTARAEVKLPQVLSEGMVLQRRAPVRIWGTAAPGEKVRVSIAGQQQNATADTGGNWQVVLKPMQAGGPHTLTVTGTNTVTVNDVLIGEVWVCSGQSNMEWNMAWLKNTSSEIATANDPQLRMFTVPHNIQQTPQTDLPSGAWQKTAPANTGKFSAVAYYFGKNLRKALGVPVGLIHTSWGGTRIEAWTRRDINLEMGVPVAEFNVPDANSPQFRAQKERHARLQQRWQSAGSPADPFPDPGLPVTMREWSTPGFDDSGWGTITLPGAWEESGKEELDGVNGAVWFRKEVTLPDDVVSLRSDAGVTLGLGAIDDFDQTFVNGVRVGVTGPETPNWWQNERVYNLPDNVLKPGKNLIAVRVWDQSGAGGLTGPANLMTLGTGKETLATLSGEWRYKVENSRPQNPGPPPNASNPNAASVLYNGMLAPILPYTIKGAIWYQGESNAGRFANYRKQLPAMIKSWRQEWKVGDFPFLIVQLAPYTDIKTEPGESNWAGLREAQMMATRALPNVGMAVITDLGEEKDIHPQRKEPVGERLALLARKMAYGEKVVANGPQFQKMEVRDGKAVLTFDVPGGKLVATPTDSAGRPVEAGKIVGFSVAGVDGKFVWADARIEGKNKIVVSAPQIEKPTVVRFGWAEFPVVNLWSASDNGTLILPASPFRTDAPK